MGHSRKDPYPPTEEIENNPLPPSDILEWFVLPPSPDVKAQNYPPPLRTSTILPRRLKRHRKLDYVHTTRERTNAGCIYVCSD
jgi:hypothetical protein